MVSRYNKKNAKIGEVKVAMQSSQWFPRVLAAECETTQEI